MKLQRFAALALMSVISICKMAYAQLPSSPFPNGISVCEESGPCAFWSFSGIHGVGHRAGVTGSLTIEKSDEHSFVLRWTDETGNAKGLTTLYIGTRTGDWIEGTFELAASNAGPKKQQKWRGAIQPVPVGVDPSTIPRFDSKTAVLFSAKTQMPRHFAVCQASNDCGKWSFDTYNGKGIWDNGVESDIKAERFLPNGVMFYRQDPAGRFRGIRCLYMGTLQGDHIEGILSYVLAGNSNPWVFSWHADLRAPVSQPTDNSIVTAKPMPGGASTEVSSLAKPLGFNLNGTWLRDDPDKSQKVVMQIYDHGNEFRMSMQNPDSQRSESDFFVGYQKDGKSVEGKSMNLAVKRSGGDAVWMKDTVSIVDPDHIALASGTRYYRVSNPDPSDAPCDARNSSRVWAVYAYMRGQVAAKKGDDASAYCWAHIGAVAGDSQSQAAVAGILLFGGPTVKADKPAAFEWAKKSADQNNNYGLMILERMYRKGEGTALDIAKADQVKAFRVKLNAPDLWGWFLNSNDANAAAGRAVLGGLIQHEINISNAEIDESQKCQQADNALTECPNYEAWVHRRPIQ